MNVLSTFDLFIYHTTEIYIYIYIKKAKSPFFNDNGTASSMIEIGAAKIEMVTFTGGLRHWHVGTAASAKFEIFHKKTESLYF